MPRVRNAGTRAETPLPQLEEALANLKPGEWIACSNTKDEILKIRENLTRGRSEIPGADDHLDYVEALLIAEVDGRLRFRT